jgi:hypothetical protein
MAKNSIVSLRHLDLIDLLEAGVITPDQLTKLLTKITRDNPPRWYRKLTRRSK